ncbi:HAD-IA family hydrolase [Chthonobacter rhizosphaerae]|uniref:HAD-IA family hydrolase n=1 Tax=Chthonobacter rhizosphaerae TaxID=2735553 RepID=UPI0015EF6D11|nr:HAD-IA family hydrolase [Chthonobacter rhizosphaerae]
MRGLKALIFDVDGTLAETEEVHRAAFNDAFKACGLPWAWDQPLYRLLLAVSGVRERIVHYVETYDPPSGAEAMARIDEIQALKTRIFNRLVDDRHCPFRPGVERLLEEAKSRGLKLALATTGPIPNVESLIIANLDYAGLDRFDAIVGGEAVEARKPAPDIYRMAIDALGLPARTCLVFEDSLNGLKAATAAGARTVVTPSVYTANQDFSGAFAVVSHLGDPFDPYEHLGGAGDRDRMVTVNALRRWMDDDDDMRSLLTIGGRSVY